jgi:hypothetical protein
LRIVAPARSVCNIDTNRVQSKGITGTLLDELSRVRPFFLIITLLVTSSARGTPADTSLAPKSEPQLSKTKFDLSARFANESNWADGVWGPVTYGLIGDIVAESGLELDATFIRMHEPGMATFNSVLDEGQLSLKYPLSTMLSVDGTFWKNRMMDMYTTLGGLEFERTLDPISLNLGLYAGSASRFEVAGRFLGAGLEISATIGKIDIALSHLAGLIHIPNDPSGLGVGKYHKSGLEASMDLDESIKFPLRSTLSVERRYFDFGSGGPVSEPIDTYIVVVGVEVGLTPHGIPE